MSDPVVNITHELFEELNAVCEGHQAADVVYAIGMLLAYAIKTTCVTQDPAPTMGEIRKIIDLEMNYQGSRTNRKAAEASPPLLT